MPFTFMLGDQCHMNVSKDLLSLRFNLRIGTMYVEQKMYYVDGDILETILLQKTMNEYGHSWILDSRLFRVTCIFYSQVQSSIVVLTNNPCTFIVQLPIFFYVKIEPSKDIVILF